MPKIPTYNAQLGLTKQVPAIRTDPNVAGMQARAVGEIGGVLFTLGENIKKIRVEDEIGKATIEGARQIGQLELDAANDPELNGYKEKYTKRLNEVRDSVMNGIKDNEAAREFGGRFELSLVDSRMKINQFYNKKAIDSGLATLNIDLEMLQEEYINISDPNLKQRKLDEIAFKLSTASDLGLMTKKDAQKSLSNIKANLPKKQVEWDIYNDTATDEIMIRQQMKKIL